MSLVATAPGLLMLAALAASGAVAGQDRRSNEISLWYTLAKDYRQGRAEPAIDALVALPPGATKGLVTSEDLGLFPEEMNAAALLETEAGFRSGSLTVLSARLSNAYLLLRRAHRDLKRQRLDTRLQDDLRRQWSRTIGRRALWQTMVGVVDAMLKEACETFPDDGALHLIYGTLNETAALSVDRIETIKLAPIGLESVLSSHSTLRADALSRARDALERAVELNPASAEARLRLGRVYILLKEERRAIPHLEHARTEDALFAYRYLASIMLGDLRRRTGEIEPAIELYLSARRLLPNAQSSYVAHAHALRAAGRSEEATAVIGEMLGRTTHEDDPWVSYPRGFEHALTEFGPLRALVQEK